ncbi:MAG: O-methyltransferase [Lachnospiraceae bacterium]|nr:O-methyltransferase [Lachnospiraceae bacterium]
MMNYIDEDRLNIFLETISLPIPELLTEIEENALKEEVPVIRKGTQGLLRVLMEIKKPERILEVGTAVGFSALLMLHYSKASVVTIENYDKRIPKAKENFKRAGMQDRVTLLEGDAQKILPTMDDSFDVIFLDAAKGQYSTYYPDLMRMLKPGGILISDNVLQEGSILDSRFASERRDRTIHKRIREYLQTISTDPELETTILPVGDGTAVSVRKS